MTSISSSTSFAAMRSPNERMKLQLQSAVSTGTVKATDQSALSSALDDIDSALKAGGAPKPGTDPSSMKTKIDSLVDQEVSDGKLTDDQATELKKLFATAAQQGPGGAQGMQGPPPPPPSDGSDSDDVTSTSSTDSTGSTASTDETQKAIETLMAFLQKLETTSSSTYGADGSNNGTKVSSLLVDKTA